MDLIEPDFSGALFALLIVGVVVGVAGILLMVFVKHQAMRWLGGAIVLVGTLFAAFMLMLLLSDLRVR